MLDWDNPSTWVILLVEDEPDNREVIAESLRFFGASVQTATNGLEGLEVLKGYAPSLILLDLSMPKMDGWEMRKHVKSTPETAHIPIVALTAHAMAGDRERALAVGFDGYLSKPVNIPTLIQDLHNGLKSLPDEQDPQPSLVQGTPVGSHAGGEQ